MSYLYRNLRTRLWQVNDKPKSSATAVTYDVVAMHEVTFRVSETVRQWCLSHAMPSGKPYRQVHAFAVGTVVSLASVPNSARVPVSYNPARGGTFYRCDTGAAVQHCEYVVFDSRGAWAIGAIK